MYFPLTILLAASLTIIQKYFFSHLPSPFSDLNLAVVAITWSVISGRPLTAALWALVSGVLADLHGLFGFGAETAALFIAFAAAHVMFARLFTNATLIAAFPLAAGATAARLAFLATIDGVRTVFGGVPYLIAPDWDFIPILFRSIIANGLATVLLLAIASSLKRRMDRTFLKAPERVR